MSGDHGDSGPAREYRPTVVGGRYRVTGVRVQAAWGDVVEAHDVREDREVVLKRVRRPDQQATTRLRTVHRTMSGLRHPATMDVLDLVEGRGDSWLVAARAPGDELLAWWARLPLGPASRFEERWTFAGPLFLALLEGTEAMHRAGLAHLDIKPRNIRVDRLGRVVLVDLGFGQPMRREEPAGGDEASLGAHFGYTAPELVDGLAVSRHADQWSLGAVLYRLLGGRRPLPARSVGELEAQYEAAKVTPLHELLPDVPPDVEAIVAKMLAWWPEDRFEGLSSVRIAMGGLLEPLPEPSCQPWSVPPPALVGRDPFLAYFRRRLAEMEKGRGGALVRLVAPEGSGKSRLLDAWADLARARGGSDVHACTCRPGWPRTVLAGWFRPPPGDIGQAPPRDLVEQALGALTRPAVLLLDALEEVDAVTWARVHRVAGHAAGGEVPLLVVLSGRALPDLGPRVTPESPRFFNIELPPLGRSAVTGLLSPASDEADDIQVRDGAAEAYCDEAHGQPGALLRVLLDDEAAGRLVRSGRRWQVRLGQASQEQQPPARPALHDSFLAWIAELGGTVEVEILLECLSLKRRMILESLVYAASRDEIQFRRIDGRWWARLAPGAVSSTVQVHGTPQTHDRVARWLEANGDMRGLTAERVARHWHKAVDYQAASVAFREAATAEAGIGNNADARRLDGIARALAARAAGSRRQG